MLAAIAGDQGGIGLIRLGGRQLGCGKSFDDGRIDYAYQMPGLVQINGQGFAISAGGFQTGVDRASLVRWEPGGELPIAGAGVGKEAVTEFAVPSQ